MKYGYKPEGAANLALQTISEYYPHFNGAVIVVDKNGHYGAACHGFDQFPYSVANSLHEVSIFYVNCTKSS